MENLSAHRSFYIIFFFLITKIVFIETQRFIDTQKAAEVTHTCIAQIRHYY